MDDQPRSPLTAPHDRLYPEDDPREPPLPLPPPATAEPPPVPPPPAVPPRRRSRLGGGFSLLLVLLIVGGLVTWVIMRAENKAPPTGRFQSGGPMPVGTVQVAKGDMPIILNALGTVTPLAIVTVKTQIAGQLIEVGYKEGQTVNKGDFLAQIDPRPYQVALAQAEGQLAKDQAALKNSEVDLARYRTLLAQNSIARQQLDTQAALVEQNRGTVRADQALVDTQKLNLTYSRIVAPTGGRVGLRQVDPGNYVQTGDANGIVVITQLQPISVIFTLPEDNLRPVMKRMREGATLTVAAYDRTGANKLETGKLQTVDNQIDPSTGTVKLRAVFDNPEQMLFPNQFVNIQLLVDTLHDASLVPVSAIQRGAPGTFVYVVKDDSTVAATPVKLGPSDSQNVSISQGVQPGQVIVMDGADRLKDGAKVTLTDKPNQGGQAAPGEAGKGRRQQQSGLSSDHKQSADSKEQSESKPPADGKSDASSDRPRRRRSAE